MDLVELICGTVTEIQWTIKKLGIFIDNRESVNLISYIVQCNSEEMVSKKLRNISMFMKNLRKNDKNDFLFHAWYVKSIDAITHHCCLITRDKLNKLKINDFLGPIRALRSQDKLPSWNLERQVNTESQNWHFLKFIRSHWSNTLVRTLERCFWRIRPDWVRISLWVRYSCSPWP